MNAQERILQECRLCKSARIKFLLKKDDAMIFKCRDCGIVFLGNDLDEESVKDLYKYYAHSEISNYLSPITKLRYEKLLDGFEKYRKNNRLIDVGCGAGYFVMSASKRGWQAEGTEISDEAIKLAEEKGQKVFKGNIEGLGLEKETYDIATLFEVAEHALNPEGMIKKINSILREQGMLYITTLNYNSVTRRLLGKRWGMFHKEHIFYFTPRILKSILNKNGFKIKKIKAENLSLIETSKLFKKEEDFDFKKIYRRQEKIRDLAEKKPFFSFLKCFANFILNLSGSGEAISVLAQKKSPILTKSPG